MSFSLLLHLILFCSIWQDMIQYHHGGRAIPAIWFRYELSPITVRYKEKRPPFYTFLTTVSLIFIQSSHNLESNIV